MTLSGTDGSARAPSAVPVPEGLLDAAREAEAATRAVNAALLERLPFHDRQDFDDARRGLVAPVPGGGVVRGEGGAVLWNIEEYGFLDGEQAPATVNPSLWRMARLNLASGLFRVVDRVYQLRGFDLANMTVLEGDTGLIVIDPLTTAESAKAAFDLYCAHRPRRPVIAVIYTHSHVDHFGGVKGVVAEADVRAGRVAVIAPDGFMEGASGARRGRERHDVARRPRRPGPRADEHSRSGRLGRAHGRGRRRQAGGADGHARPLRDDVRCRDARRESSVASQVGKARPPSLLRTRQIS